MNELLNKVSANAKEKYIKRIEGILDWHFDEQLEKSRVKEGEPFFTSFLEEKMRKISEVILNHIPLSKEYVTNTILTFLEQCEVRHTDPDVLVSIIKALRKIGMQEIAEKFTEKAIECAYDDTWYGEKYAGDIAKELGLEKRATELYTEMINGFSDALREYGLNAWPDTDFPSFAKELIECATSEEIKNRFLQTLLDVFQKEKVGNGSIGFYHAYAILKKMVGENKEAEELYCKELERLEKFGHFELALDVAKEARQIEQAKLYQKMIEQEKNIRNMLED